MTDASLETAPAPAPDAPSQSTPLSGEATGTLPAAEWPAWAPAMPDHGSIPEAPPQLYGESCDEYERGLDRAARAPSDYQLPPMIEGDMPSMEEWQALQGIQSLLWHGAFPVVAGNRLMETIAQEAKRLGDTMDDAAFELQCQATDATLEKLYGPERLQALRGKLSSFLTDLAKKTTSGSEDGLGDVYEAYGHILATPRVMAELFAHVERLDLRRR